MTANGLEGLEHDRQISGVIPEGGDRIEVRALVVGDVRGVMAEKIPTSLTYQTQKLLVAERAPVDRSADLGGHGYTLPPWFVSIFGSTTLEDRRDMVTGRGKLLDEPRPREGTSACEEDFHGNHRVKVYTRTVGTILALTVSLSSLGVARSLVFRRQISRVAMP